MLFLTFGNLLMFSIQLISETFRYQRYRRIMQRLLRTAGILVQRTKNIHTDDPMKKLPSSSTGLSENVEFQDDYIQISSRSPMQKEDLNSWTAYTSYLETRAGVVAGSSEDIHILMEAQRPRDMKTFVDDSLRIPPAYRVHVLSVACPVAWKTAEPFRIILKCSLSGLVTLSDAFGQGWLTLDEDLELIGFYTVKTIGTPQPLLPQHRELWHKKEHHKLMGDTLSLSKDGDKDITWISRSSQVKHQSSYNESSQKNTFSIARLQEVSVQSDVSSSSSNFELDHTETFVSKKESAQINGKKQAFNDETAKSNFEVNHNNVQAESASIRHENDGRGSRMKPPNILIYCGIKDSVRKFSEVKSSLESCINADAYTIYHLSHDSVLSTPWRSNTALLVVSSCSQLRREVEDQIANFVLKDRGVLLSFNSSVDSVFVGKSEEKGVEGEKLFTFKLNDAQQCTSVRGRFYYHSLNENSDVVVPYECTKPQENGHISEGDGISGSINEQNKALVMKIRCPGGGTAVFSQLLLERDPTEYAKDLDSFAALKHSNADRLTFLRDLLTSLGIDTSSGTVPLLTPCLLLAQRVGLKEIFLESFKHRLKDGVLKSQKMSLKFVHSPGQAEPTMATLLPVLTSSEFDARTEYFSAQSYWKHLNTSKLGQVVFYTDVITSTMGVFDGLQFSVPRDVGLIAIAGRQTSGRGRGGNSWLSPVGCAMFTLPLTLSLDSELGQRVSFLQHIVSLAVVKGVLTLPGYENLDIKLKWPNDLYYGKEMKLGGVLVTSTVMDSIIYATIGCGFNVSNSNPTICINDIIRHHNLSHPHLPELLPLNSSQMIARTVTCLEGLLDSFEKQGHHTFCDQYYKHWLHSGTRVHLQLDNQETDGEIVGLDDYGFLSVLVSEGVISVQPDGNSFDMLHNLIHVKPRS